LAEHLFGSPPGTLAGRPLEELIPTRLRERHRHHFKRYSVQPYFRLTGAGVSLWALRRDGSEFSAEISLNPLHTRSGIFTVAMIRDVSEHGRARQALERTATDLEQQLLERNAALLEVNAELRQQIRERIQTEIALREAEAEYRQLVENQPDLICRFLPDTTLTFVNAAYAQFFGKTAQELIGQRFIAFLSATEQAAVEAQLGAGGGGGATGGVRAGGAVAAIRTSNAEGRRRGALASVARLRAV